ncbi:hypothetical protein M407DRAFT_30772 [Tulasnella calospora MUT 4182]|uniref:Uncharacterized protein n=1 Tax=Tulasnella calospora MUT 4182 TaxID=1051891 RepID=A0A0C3PWY6_9AGAM|nr:hypothetical protein M407DRAFT_30772 [Tulasnella calospora MUT 4182]
MSSAPHVERFKGTDWEECHDFIAAIRARALWEGKQRDSAWKADFAAPLFWGKALSWHSRLPEDVREDWSKLEIALLDRWPPQEDDDDPQIKPTPAAAPSLNRNGNPPLQGILTVVPDGSNTKYYLRLGSDYCEFTTDADQAIRVRCNSLSSTTLLERIGNSSVSWLAFHWQESMPDIGAGSTDFARISCVNLDTMKSSWNRNGPFRLITCSVSGNGEVIPVWKKDNTSEITLVPFANTSYIYLAADPEAYSGEYPSENRAKLFIEPTN